MRILHTFWSGPKQESSDMVIRKDGGWIGPEYYWMSWAFSCLQLKKLGYEVSLHTDSAGQDILIKKLGLPYDHVRLSLDGTLNQYPSGLFSLAKLHTYSTQEEPFIHIDGDVFLFQRFDEQFASSAIVAQNLEVNLFFYREILEQVTTNAFHLPSALQGLLKQEQILAANAGIIGGSNLDFIRRYCKDGFDFIDNNFERLSCVNTSQLNFLFEQCHLYYKAMEENENITFFMNDAVDHPLYQDYARFSDVPKVPMIHTVGGFKKFAFVCDHLASQLQKDFPDYYYAVIDLALNAGVKLRARYYQRKNFNFTDREQSFIRTRQLMSAAGLDHKNKEHDLRAGIETQSNGAVRRILFDVYLLEEMAMTTGNTFYKNNNVQSEYSKSTKHYRNVQDLFNNDNGHPNDVMVCLNTNVAVVESLWRWDVKEGADFQSMFTERITESEQAGCVRTALVPDVLLMSVSEKVLDDLDHAVISECVRPVSIADLIEAMKKYFEHGDDFDFDQFQRLIVDTVKRLLFERIILLQDV
jgi:hypothetical protein